MSSFYTESVVQTDGKIVLDHVPFTPGETVQVVIAPLKMPAGERYPLRGTVLKYERPFEPVAQEDWTAAK